MKTWLNKGEHWVWYSAAAAAASVVMVFGLLIMIAFKGLSHFWPHAVYEFQIQPTPSAEVQLVQGEIHDTRMRETRSAEGVVLREPQILIKTGNRDIYSFDFRWVDEAHIVNQTWVDAEGISVIQRYASGNMYGYIQSFKNDQGVITEREQVFKAINKAISDGNKIRKKINHLEKSVIGGINHQLQALRYDQRKLEMRDALTPEIKADYEAKAKAFNDKFGVLQIELDKFYKELRALGDVTVRVGTDQEVQVNVSQFVRFWQPSEMHIGQKMSHFFGSVGIFLWDEPREANTEGGVFPAIVGTLTMVIMMTIFVMPMGVIAAIYMREYAKEGKLLRLIRISINNLAGVPSIVFGIFGLGFFVYVLGYSVDQMFYSHALPNPTFGTPGLLWASLTMALLTLPVVIVATDEGLSRIPRALREGGLALGATKAEVITRIVLPMTTPAIMTGLILAVARAAGEVAPLMLVGVVKKVTELPVNLNAPFVHLDQKFMHLGFHIYDVGFQSPNVEAAQPLVYATSLLLVILIVSLNLAAIMIRNRLREKYKSLEH
ncbi:phosphate ABC transporter permease PstA [Thiomicrospira microaerophila]|uniref:phosphate ABC transporter permease PstA n=1 Tax=Thiomicrospira microaerophila TaxID=406020 RepID=UPI00200D99F0|nr:phosphate ABC transporter permease PstA [Thiomicrospira microaerophila]UQB43115.1 phosphate ABC transporter permease PstA [Thiomicrospira microaerophila]